MLSNWVLFDCANEGLDCVTRRRDISHLDGFIKTVFESNIMSWTRRHQFYCSVVEFVLIVRLLPERCAFMSKERPQSILCHA